MRRSVVGTGFIIVLLFWIMHRRWLPLLWLMALLAVVLGATLAVGGLVFGQLNVVSAGFAAILLGVTVDYGMVLYQEARHAENTSAKHVRRLVAPGILWAALTTAAAFAALNFSSLPGLSQLGSLVAIGVLIGAATMLAFYLPPIVRRNIATPRTPAGASGHDSTRRRERSLAWSGTACLLLFAALALWRGGPEFNASAEALRPEQSPAYATLEEITRHLGREDEPLWLVFRGDDEETVARQLDHAAAVLDALAGRGEIRNYTLPGSVFPRPEHHAANRSTAALLEERRNAIRETVLAHGFTAESLALSEEMFDTWKHAAAAPGVFWPQTEISRWVLDKVAARDADGVFVLGMIHPIRETDRGEIARIKNALSLPERSMWLTDWGLLGTSVFNLVRREVAWLAAPMFALLVIALSLAFRRPKEVLLSLATLAFSGICLWAVMGTLGWSWNLLNLMALPLLLGLCIDYSIHVQLALRRHDGDTRAVRRTIGRALMLCAATTIAAFGSLGFSNNAGLASLGQVCALGIAVAYVTAVFLLPAWWQTGQGGATTRPPIFYRAFLWRLGIIAVRRLSTATCRRMAEALAAVYWRASSRRRAVVIRNLLPAVDDDPVRAVRLGRQLFRNFAQKLLDLWRYEGGLAIDHLITHWTGWETFVAAQQRGRGVLLLTPHLGNWEFGAPLLATKGVQLLVITQDEPDPRLTDLRRASRARWGIETLVIGQDPFAPVEIIKRLEAGSTVALLVDRPPPGSAVRVELFGRPFDASIAAAELARASGCALLPVYLPRHPAGYTAHVLPEIPYDRPRLREYEARRQLTRRIIAAFEPVIQRHADQWYHFVPIWTENGEQDEREPDKSHENSSDDPKAPNA